VQRLLPDASVLTLLSSCGCRYWPRIRRDPVAVIFLGFIYLIFPVLLERRFPHVPVQASLLRKMVYPAWYQVDRREHGSPAE
jgi:hypothetical protein